MITEREMILGWIADLESHFLEVKDTESEATLVSILDDITYLKLKLITE